MHSAFELFRLPYDLLVPALGRLVLNSNPMWHPLGFVSATLLKQEDQTLKIHLWPRGTRKEKEPNWPIHDHSFHITSRVLVGEVGNAEYRVTRGHQFRLYRVEYHGNDSVLCPTNECVDCVEHCRTVTRAGAEYALPLGVYHQNVVPRSETALTLVIKAGAAKQSPNVVGDLVAPHLPIYRRVPFATTDILEVLSKIAPR